MATHSRSSGGMSRCGGVNVVGATTKHSSVPDMVPWCVSVCVICSSSLRCLVAFWQLPGLRRPQNRLFFQAWWTWLTSDRGSLPFWHHPSHDIACEQSGGKHRRGFCVSGQKPCCWTTLPTGRRCNVVPCPGRKPSLCAAIYSLVLNSLMPIHSKSLQYTRRASPAERSAAI